MLTFLAQLEENRVRNAIDFLARTPQSQILMLVAVLTALRIALYPKLTKTPRHLRSGSWTIAKFANEFFDAVIYAGVVVFMALRPFVVQTFTIPTGSMLETLQINDFVALDKSIYRRSEPKFGDIIVFKAPDVSRRPGEGELDFIKRCRGVPGDVIEIRNGEFYRNGKKEDEKFVRFAPGMNRMIRDWKLVEKDGQYIPVYIESGMANRTPGFTADSYVANSIEVASDLLRRPPAKIPAGHYLFMGDNREESYDGRSWGLVKREAIIGKSAFVWWPPSRWRGTN